MASPTQQLQQVQQQQQQSQYGPLDATTKQNATGGFNNPQLDTIGGWVQQYTGKAPTYADVSQWGTGGADTNYMDAIQSAIYNSQGAQDYRNTPAAAPGPTASPDANTPPTDSTGGIPAAPASPPVNIGALTQQYKSMFAPSTPLPTTGLQTYTPNSNLLGVDGQAAQTGTMNLLQSLLANPDVMSAQDVGVQNEQSKAAALANQQSLMKALGDQQAGLGRFGSGYQQAQGRRINDSTISQILGAQQTNQLNADQANATNRLNVANTGNSILNDVTGRAQAQSAENLQGVNSQNAATQYGFQQALANDSLGQESNQLALQAALGDAGSQLGYYQTNSNNNNTLAQLLQQMSMFNTSQQNNVTNS